LGVRKRERVFPAWGISFRVQIDWSLIALPARKAGSGKRDRVLRELRENAETIFLGKEKAETWASR